MGTSELFAAQAAKHRSMYDKWLKDGGDVPNELLGVVSRAFATMIRTENYLFKKNKPIKFCKHSALNLMDLEGWVKFYAAATMLIEFKEVLPIALERFSKKEEDFVDALVKRANEVSEVGFNVLQSRLEDIRKLSEKEEENLA